jgi:hypothetical protein
VHPKADGGREKGEGGVVHSKARVDADLER